ncbi:hypothetical protein [Lacinutrix mariniflava]|uniref:hypothetical protein n=1 Tax=Lacinutrix mariniflava TaxID=342955 RepID=UPI0006E11F80|nr:hypothetical protein [Lacinutrix mariniflava]
MTKNSNVFSGWFQVNIINNFKIFRKPYKITDEWFGELDAKHYSSEFTSKYNENLFVDQDQDAGQALINEILLNETHFGYLSNELRILNDWIEGFIKEYKNLKSLLDIENIKINKSSKQYTQLEFLLKNSNNLLRYIKLNNLIIGSDKIILPLKLNKIDNKSLKVSEGFSFQKLIEYNQEYRFIEQEPSDSFSVVIVFRRLSQIVTQIASVNRLIEQKKVIH